MYKSHLLMKLETILNAFRNSVPNKYTTVDDKDPVKKHTLKRYIQNHKSNFMFLENLATEHNESIFSTKTFQYKNLEKKLNNLLLQAKRYCSIPKMFYKDEKNYTISTSFDRCSLHQGEGNYFN